MRGIQETDRVLQNNGRITPAYAGNTDMMVVSG